ncbi:MAG: T9SS type A sorting domain-containing protein [Chitinophagaceae bacterium]|nr:MAG: T9SS type A sorting domain-containing protein [Chitinophagaceae bacterium]
MMKKLLLLSALALGLCGQAQRTCGTPQKIQERLQTSPEFQANYEIVRQQLRNAATQQALSVESTAAQPSVVVTVQVVVHVLYKNATQNVSDAQIASQLTVLNNDFRKLNTDFATVVPTVFQPFGADLEINFVMATTDPNGDPTTGITRKSVSNTFNFDNQYYQAAGQPAWDTTSYLNIWVGNFTNPGLLGFAYPPGASGLDFDGLCIDYDNFGTIGTADAPFNKGRTGTHEIGHYFGLEHPWGDDMSNCGQSTNSDGAGDTPAVNGPTYGCPEFPDYSTACSSTGNGSMFMNFMDYVDDGCMAFFTNGQKLITNAAVNGPRAGVLLGTSDLSSVASVKVYPNPVGSSFQVTSSLSELSKVELFNIGGQLVKSQNLSGLEASVDMSGFESGLYFARFYSGTKLLKSEKIVKQ